MNFLDPLFSWFSEATVRGSLLAIAVLFLQGALGRRLPANWRYAMWLPVVFVLVAPILPQSRFSLENRFPAKVERVQLSALPTMTALPVMGSEAKAVVPISEPIAWRPIFQLGWLAGVIGTLVFALSAYLRTLGRIERGRVDPEPGLVDLLAETARSCGLDRAPRLVVSTAVESPAVTGFLRPLLLLPAGFPGDFKLHQAKLILAHELTHLKRHDLALNWLLCLVQAFHWCNPVLAFVFSRIRADRETACDAQVLALTPEDQRVEYGYALLRFEGVQGRVGLGFVGIFERAAGIRSRIQAIAGYRRSHPAWGLLSLLLISSVALIGATRALSTEEPKQTIEQSSIMVEAKILEIDWAGNRLAETSGIGPEVLNTLKKLGGEEAVVCGTLNASQTDFLLNLFSKGGTVVASPKLLTRSGQKARIETGREIRYASAYEPGAEPGSWNPSNYKSTMTGLSLEVEAAVQKDGLVNLELNPQVVDLLGFAPYEKTGKLPAEQQEDLKAEAPSGSRSQPVFSTRKISAQVGLQPGQTVVLGGFQRTVEPAANAPVEKASKTRLVILMSAEVINRDPLKKQALTITSDSIRVDKGVTTASGNVKVEAGQTIIRAEQIQIQAKHPKALQEQLERIRIPVLEFSEASGSECVDFLRLQARRLDPKGEPVNILLSPKAQTTAQAAKVTLSLRNISLSDAIRYVAELCSLRAGIYEGAVLYRDASEESPADFRLAAATPGPDQLSDKLSLLIVPKIRFQDALFSEVIEYMRAYSRKAEPTGVNIVVTAPAAAATEGIRISLNLTGISFADAMKYIAQLSGVELVVSKDTLLIRTPGEAKAKK